MVEVFEFQGKEKGKNLLITGGIHGNEVCGPIALRKWVEEFQAGKRILEKGTLRLIPCCNPRAYAKNRRYIDMDMNRSIKQNASSQHYEEKLAQELLPHLDWADFGVDIHSYTSSNEPFVFCDVDTPSMIEFSRMAPIDYIVTGFDEMLKNQNITTFCSVQGYYISKNKDCVTIECGQHTSPTSPLVAYQSVENYLGLLGYIRNGNILKGNDKNIRVKRIFYKEKEGDFAKAWGNLEAVAKDTVLAVYEDGTELKAPFDGLILLPAPAKTGEDWFYMAVEENW